MVGRPAISGAWSLVHEPAATMPGTHVLSHEPKSNRGRSAYRSPSRFGRAVQTSRQQQTTDEVDEDDR